MRTVDLLLRDCEMSVGNAMHLEIRNVSTHSNSFNN